MQRYRSYGIGFISEVAAISHGQGQKPGCWLACNQRTWRWESFKFYRPLYRVWSFHQPHRKLTLSRCACTPRNPVFNDRIVAFTVATPLSFTDFVRIMRAGIPCLLCLNRSQDAQFYFCYTAEFIANIFLQCLEHVACRRVLFAASRHAERLHFQVEYIACPELALYRRMWVLRELL